jgi:hypothetical protein
MLLHRPSSHLLLKWIDHKNHLTRDEEENMKNTRKREMRIRHLCRIEEHSLCTIIVMLDLRRMVFGHLAGAEVVGAGPVLEGLMHLSSISSSSLS